jgi:AcrR family transcriptional regulator
MRGGLQERRPRAPEAAEVIMKRTRGRSAPRAEAGARRSGVAAAAARRRDRKATTEGLLTAAVEVFARRGYDAATTRAVAARAGVNDNLITRYFGGKAGLLLAVLKDCGSDEKRRACSLPPARASAFAEIRSLLEFHLRHAFENRDFLRVVMYRAIVDPAVAAEIGRHFFESRVPLILERLRALRAKGRIGRRADLAALAHALSTLSFGLAFLDQVVFDRDRAALRRVIAGAARALAAGMMD